MVRKGVIATLCVVSLFLAACKSKASEPIDPARVAANRAVLEDCRDTALCVGGFVKYLLPPCDRNRILRIEHGNKMDSMCGTVGVYYLYDRITYEWVLNGFTFVLPGDSQWEETAIAYAKQFVERREKK